MNKFFINLKRFDVPREKGGVCPHHKPEAWIKAIIEKSVEMRRGIPADIQVVIFVPESLIIPAQEALEQYPLDWRGDLQVGCQSVFRDNIEPSGNFGAFTSNMPAASAYQMGCRWTMIGHSEERHDKQEIIGAFQPDWNQNETTRKQCAAAVDVLINREVLSALKQGMHVLLCVGETSEERGNGSWGDQQQRIRRVLTNQLRNGLREATDYLPDRKIVIGYEPIWAIGPGKAPPDKEYIAFVSELIKDTVKNLYGFDIEVVYGGGLKEENAAIISGIKTLDGGLVALTRFSGEIGFYVEDLIKIINKCIL